MHYADGTEARVGDIVIGKGYNIKDEAGALKEISGIMHQITPEATTCNCQILLLEPIKEFKDGQSPQNIWPNTVIIAGKVYYTKIEYGQCNHFRLATQR